MPDSWAGLAGRTVADHELTFFCEIDGIPLSGPRLPMAALAEGDLLSDALSFRLGFRFSEVSYISMHNEINRAFRTVMSLDRMLRDLGDDVTAVEGFLSSQAAKARAEAAHTMERRFYWTSVLGVMALSGLTAFTIIKEVALAIEGGKPADLFALIGGIAVALLAGLVGLWRRLAPRASGGHVADHFTDHAMTEHMIHAAGRKGQAIVPSTAERGR